MSYKNIKKILCSIFCICFLCVFFTGCNNINFKQNKESMSLNYKNGFKIMQLADIQVSSSSQCNKAFQEITKLVSKEKPDLIVLTGDNVSYPNSSLVVKSLINNMDKLNTPWTAVFGNHDGEGALSNAQIALMFEQSNNCIFKNPLDNIYGDSNFTISLIEDNNIKYGLVFIDSNAYYDTETQQPSRFITSNTVYDYIHEDQIIWYEEQINNLKSKNNNVLVPTLAFFHIPLPEYKDAQALLEKDSTVGHGIFKEETCSPEYNSGLFDKMKQLNSTKAILCGHEHINTCDIMYENIRLVYGLKSSRYSYYDENMLGATIITLNDTSIIINNSYF